jgi:hypothetical protein
MSRATALVRFPDGTVRCTLYNGTVDMLFPALRDTIADAWDRNHPDRGNGFDPDPADGFEEEFAVVIATDYGSGFYWPGRATRSLVIGPLEPWDHYDTMIRGKPDWWADAYPTVRGAL